MTTVFITDIPAPYRIEMYNTLAALMADLEVWYFQKESIIRPWKFDKSKMKHKYWVAGGLYKRIGIYNLFINPNLIIKLLLMRPENIILAAGWNDFDVLMIVILKRLGLINSKISFWSEANHLTIGASKDNWLKAKIRRFVYNACDGYQLVSGDMTRITLRRWGIKNTPEIFFPNTIEEAVHNGEIDPPSELQRQNNYPVILVPARLDEKYKGLINFLSSLSITQIKSVEIRIAGEGVDKVKLENFIKDKGYGLHVKLIGQLSASDLAVEYSRADAFCLPSFSDPSPLSVIEAMRWGLPLLLSQRCGNHYEAVQADENGMTFDPHNRSDISRTFDKFLACEANWEEMGCKSRERFNDIFRKQAVLENFVRTLYTS